MASSTVPSTCNSEDALREYFALREDFTTLEGREAECTRDTDEFHTCEVCQDYAEKNRRAKNLLELWGDNWAVELRKLRPGDVNPCRSDVALPRLTVYAFHAVVVPNAISLI